MYQCLFEVQWNGYGIEWQNGHSLLQFKYVTCTIFAKIYYFLVHFKAWPRTWKKTQKLKLCQLHVISFSVSKTIKISQELPDKKCKCPNENTHALCRQNAF
jgi:hypothetical protein